MWRYNLNKKSQDRVSVRKIFFFFNFHSRLYWCRGNPLKSMENYAVEYWDVLSMSFRGKIFENPRQTTLPWSIGTYFPYFPWNAVETCSILSMDHFPWISTAFHVKSTANNFPWSIGTYFPWNAVAFHRMPWHSIECRGIPWNAVECGDIP